MISATGRDTSRDSSGHTGRDTSRDTGRDTSRFRLISDTSRGNRRDTGRDTSPDTSRDTGRDTIWDTRRDLYLGGGGALQAGLVLRRRRGIHTSFLGIAVGGGCLRARRHTKNVPPENTKKQAPIKLLLGSY